MNVKRWMGEVAQLPCVVCQRIGLGETPAHVHHLFPPHRRNDWLVAPVCPEHHTGKDGIHGAHRVPFQERFKIYDEDMMADTIKRVVARI